MRVLVVGGGAREHALAWKLSRAAGIDELYAAPGNPGMAGIATCVPIAAEATVELAEFAASLHIDLTVVGPELPLVLGIADEFARRGLLLVGPSRAAAEVEGSKVFTKEFCLRHGIPTARAKIVRNRDEAAAAVKELKVPVVFKADGLAAGKGVQVCRRKGEVEAALARYFEERAFGAAGEKVLVEECLEGEEISFMVLTDGASVLPLASARDYKRLEDGDGGPNTGGMGSVSPAPMESGLATGILRTIVHPTIAGLAAEGRPYRGVLYAGVMVTKGRPAAAGVQLPVRRPGDAGGDPASGGRPASAVARRGARRTGCAARQPGSGRSRCAWCWRPTGTRRHRGAATPSRAWARRWRNPGCCSSTREQRCRMGGWSRREGAWFRWLGAVRLWRKQREPHTRP